MSSAMRTINSGQAPGYAASTVSSRARNSAIQARNAQRSQGQHPLSDFRKDLGKGVDFARMLRPTRHVRRAAPVSSPVPKVSDDMWPVGLPPCRPTLADFERTTTAPLSRRLQVMMGGTSPELSFRLIGRGLHRFAVTQPDGDSSVSTYPIEVSGVSCSLPRGLLAKIEQNLGTGVYSLAMTGGRFKRVPDYVVEATKFSQDTAATDKVHWRGFYYGSSTCQGSPVLADVKSYHSGPISERTVPRHVTVRLLLTPTDGRPVSLARTEVSGDPSVEKMYFEDCSESAVSWESSSQDSSTGLLPIALNRSRGGAARSVMHQCVSLERII